MSKKLYGLISTLVTCAGTTAVALVTFFQPANFGAIIGAIGIAVPAINDILLLFVNEEGKK
ncbi:MAG: hypothetical protein IKY09_02745 [Methanocorpusculum sp.]|nr:hypothetical protein [Methanocorpusculum sp.]MBR5450168.1 hypothetical protein [Methanocorpusculum sp.]